MQWLDNIVHSFIMTFGITEPSADKRRAANLFIGFLLVAVVALFFGVVVFGVRQLLR